MEKYTVSMFNPAVVWTQKARNYAAWLPVMVGFLLSIKSGHIADVSCVSDRMCNLSLFLANGNVVSTDGPSEEVSSLLGDLPNNSSILKVLERFQEVYTGFVEVFDAALYPYAGCPSFSEALSYRKLLDEFGTILRGIIKEYEGYQSGADADLPKGA